MKRKVLIGASAGVVAAATIATSLALALPKVNSVVENMDVKYGVNQALYNSMKTSLLQQYLNKLKFERWSDPIIDEKMNSLKSSLVEVDTKISQLKQHNSSNVYTTATTAVLKLAKNKYGVNLIRKTRANWNEVQTMFSGMKDSFGTYMENHNISRTKQAQVLVMADQKYNTMMNTIKSEYANDILSGVLKAKQQLVSCFDSVNTEIAKLAGTIRLNEFVNNYLFTFRDNAKSYTKATDVNFNRIDVLIENKKLQLNQPILPDVMNSIFTCFNVETRQYTDFNPNMLPGYTIQAVYKGLKSDTLANKHELLIDWTIVSDGVEAQDREAATAHLYLHDKKSIDKANKGEIHSMEEALNEENSPIAITNYDVMLSTKTEKTNLTDTYFNKDAANENYIEFTWDEAKGAKPCYDGFMYADQDSSEEQILNMRQLAATGIAIKYGKETRLLKDVFAAVDVEGYEPKDLIEKFVAYCDVEDHIKITQEGNIVSNQIKVYYSNELDWKGRHQAGSTLIDVGSLVAQNFEISDEFYDEVNDKFIESYNHAHIYFDKKYKKISSHADVLDATMSVMEAFAIINATLSLGMILALVIGQNYIAAFILLILGCLEGYMGYLTLTQLESFDDKFIKPIEEYVDNANQFAETDDYHKVENKLNDDHNKFFVVPPEGQEVDPTSQEYKDKLANFRKLSPQDQKELFKVYNTFEVDFAKKFFQQAIDLKIDPQKFEKDFSGWQKKGLQRMSYFAVDAILTAIILLIGSLVAKKAKADAAASILQQEEKFQEALSLAQAMAL